MCCRCADDREARTVAEQRRLQRQAATFSDERLSLENTLRNVQTGGQKELRLILKAAEQGSLGAIQSALNKLDDPSVQINVIHTGVGAIGESDVSLASASQAIIIGYNVRPMSRGSAQPTRPRSTSAFTMSSITSWTM